MGEVGADGSLAVLADDGDAAAGTADAGDDLVDVRSRVVDDGDWLVGAADAGGHVDALAGDDLGRRPATATSVSPAQMPQIGPPKSMSRHRVRGEDAVECLAGMGHPGCS
jgi:hypothetical protein